jgi:hypothetical protein
LKTALLGWHWKIKGSNQGGTKAPRAELITYQPDHFDLYTGPDFKNIIHDQLEFLNRHFE